MIKRRILPVAMPPYRVALVSILSLLLFVVLLAEFWPHLEQRLENLSTLQLGLLASLIAGLFTAVGAIPIFFIKQLSRSIEDSLMGFGAGVMLAATAYELVLPAIDHADTLFGPAWVTILILTVGIAAGGLLLLALHKYVPHEHFILGPESGADHIKIRRVWLFIMAIALHNLPEGLAVGVGFGGNDLASGVALAIGIGLQNMPEGLVVAIALMSLGYSRMTAFGVTLITGLVQPLGGLIGVVAVSLVDLMMPFALAFAAGAMLFVISHEIIPESHSKGHQSKATFGVLLGFVVMTAIGIALG
ncbi:ZIP family metal transporter [Nitrincola sp. A-D6]|uniref:ZIP family metal transporter n=1 Tax=Nitrincola sp. A-D6 TaxID=1545442 RepID=UPI000B00EDFA|nr:ZIP family metal transporter [Nitrincola sp. A-D6]